MQKYQLLLLVSMFLNAANAQEFFESFNYSELITCPFDSGAQVEWPVGWSVYHTKNNQWNGEIDSAWCISVELVVMGFSRRMYLNAEEIDGERPVFFRYHDFDILQLPLPADMLYTMDSEFQTYNEASLIVGNTTPSESGIILSVDIPAENLVDRDQRLRYFEFQDSVGFIFSSNCFASEKFVDQELKEIVIAFSFRHTETKGRLLELYGLRVLPVYEFALLTEHTVDQNWWVDTSYLVPISVLSQWQYGWNFLLPYIVPTYPSSSHISYYDIGPAVPANTQQTITVTIDEYTSLIPQPFTALRGALVTTPDTLRHRLELLNNGGEMCIQAIELNFEEDTKYKHQDGIINMRSDLSCMMFKSGAVFEMAESSNLHYGNPGMGFLAMKQGSQMILQKNATLIIHNTLVVQLTPTTDKTHPTVFLYPGSRLIFGESARLEAWDSDDLRLRIVMLGGSVDVRHLSAEQQALIEYVYPVMPHTEDIDKLYVVHDQSNDELRIHFSSEKEDQGWLRISDLMGHIVFENFIDISPGDFYFRLNTSALDQGWLGISIQTTEKLRSTPFILHRFE